MKPTKRPFHKRKADKLHLKQAQPKFNQDPPPDPARADKFYSDWNDITLFNPDGSVFKAADPTKSGKP